MTSRKDTIWQADRVASKYLTGIRRAIPFADAQIDIMLRLIDATDRPVNSFIDLGCGGGPLGAAMSDRYPNARGVLIDFSRAMLDAARDALGTRDNIEFLALDYGDSSWLESVTTNAPYDAIVSGYSIHHQPDIRKQSLYQEIYNLLTPGGMFVNIEHVEPTSPICFRLFEDHVIDNLYAIEQDLGGPRTRDQLAHEFRAREDGQANILAPIDAQLKWLRDIGFTDVDCHFKLYELAILAGSKPA